MYETPKRQSILSDSLDNLQILMEDFQKAFSTRMASYVTEGILISLLTYLWLEYAEMGKLYHWLFPIIVSTCIVLVHGLVNEVTIKLWHSARFIIGKILLISFAGVGLGYIMAYFLGLCGLVCMVLGSYCPVAWHTSPPDMIAVFFKTILLPWGISSFFLIQALRKKQLVKELASIKKINDALAQKSLKLEIQQTADDKLPAGQFAQTHRSYIVNLQQVKKIKKEKQSYQLFLNDDIDFIPASRHRLQAFLPKLTEFLC